MKKQEIIKNYIRENNPTRKELIRFIVVEMNKCVDPDQFDSKDYRGYYSVGFTKWYNCGTVIRKNNKLYLHPDVDKYNLGLYSYTPSRWQERFEKMRSERNRLWSELRESRGEIIHLHHEIDRLEKVKTDHFDRSDFDQELNRMKISDNLQRKIILQKDNKIDDLQDIIKDLRSQLESPQEKTNEIDPDTGYTWKNLYEMYRRNYTINEMKLEEIQKTLNK